MTGEKTATEREKVINAYSMGQLKDGNEVGIFAIRNNMSADVVARMVEEEKAKGTPCEGCKYVMQRNYKSPLFNEPGYVCRMCSRYADRRDMYEVSESPICGFAS